MPEIGVLASKKLSKPESSAPSASAAPSSSSNSLAIFGGVRLFYTLVIFVLFLVAPLMVKEMVLTRLNIIDILKSVIFPLLSLAMYYGLMMILLIQSWRCAKLLWKIERQRANNEYQGILDSAIDSSHLLLSAMFALLFIIAMIAIIPMYPVRHMPLANSALVIVLTFINFHLFSVYGEIEKKFNANKKSEWDFGSKFFQCVLIWPILFISWFGYEGGASKPGMFEPARADILSLAEPEVATTVHQNYMKWVEENTPNQNDALFSAFQFEMAINKARENGGCVPIANEDAQGPARYLCSKKEAVMSEFLMAETINVITGKTVHASGVFHDDFFKQYFIIDN